MHASKGVGGLCGDRSNCFTEGHSRVFYGGATYWVGDTPTNQRGTHMTSSPYIKPRGDLLGKTRAEFETLVTTTKPQTGKSLQGAQFLYAQTNGATYKRPVLFDEAAAQDARDRLVWARVGTSQSHNFGIPSGPCDGAYADMMASDTQPPAKFYQTSPCGGAVDIYPMPRWGRSIKDDRWGSIVIPPNAIVNLFRDNEDCSLPCMPDAKHYSIFGLSGKVWRQSEGIKPNSTHGTVNMMPLNDYATSAGSKYPNDTPSLAFPDAHKRHLIYQATQLIDWDTYRFLCCTGDKGVGMHECGDLWPGAMGESKVLGNPSKCQGVFLKVCQSDNTALANSRCLSVCQAAQSPGETGLSDLSNQCDALYEKKCAAEKGKGTGHKACACLNSTLADNLIKSSEGLVPRHCADPNACSGAGVYLRRGDHTSCNICANIATTTASTGAKVAAHQALNCHGNPPGGTSGDTGGDTGDTGGDTGDDDDGGDGGDPGAAAATAAATKARTQQHLMIGGGLLVLLLLVAYMVMG